MHCKNYIWTNDAKLIGHCSVCFYCSRFVVVSFDIMTLFTSDYYSIWFRVLSTTFHVYLIGLSLYATDLKWKLHQRRSECWLVELFIERHNLWRALMIMRIEFDIESMDQSLRLSPEASLNEFFFKFQLLIEFLCFDIISRMSLTCLVTESINLTNMSCSCRAPEISTKEKKNDLHVLREDYPPNFYQLHKQWKILCTREKRIAI